MYSMVLMMAMTGSPEQVEFGRKDKGCNGCEGYTCNGCEGYTCNGCNGCNGGEEKGGFLGLRKKKKNSCNGGNGCNGCNGSSCYGSSCHGSNGHSCYGSVQYYHPAPAHHYAPAGCHGGYAAPVYHAPAPAPCDCSGATYSHSSYVVPHGSHVVPHESHVVPGVITGEPMPMDLPMNAAPMEKKEMPKPGVEEAKPAVEPKPADPVAPPAIEGTF